MKNYIDICKTFAKSCATIPEISEIIAEMFHVQIIMHKYIQIWIIHSPPWPSLRRRSRRTPPAAPPSGARCPRRGRSSRAPCRAGRRPGGPSSGLEVRSPDGVEPWSNAEGRLFFLSRSNAHFRNNESWRCHHVLKKNCLRNTAWSKISRNFLNFRERFIKICSKNGELDEKSQCFRNLRWKIIKHFDKK